MLKWGGLRLYQRLKPLFLGMIFGGFVVPVVLLVIDLLPKGGGYHVPTFP